MDLEMEIKQLAEEMNKLVKDGMVLQERHYMRMRLAIRDYGTGITTKPWFNEFIAINEDCIRQALYKE